MCNAAIIQMGIGAVTQAKQGEDDAETLRANADIMDQRARDARVRGGLEEKKSRDETRQIMGSQKAAMGASGVEADSGTYAKVQDQTTRMGEQDALTIRSNAYREAWGFDVEAAGMRKKADKADEMMNLLAPGGKDFQKSVMSKNAIFPGIGGYGSNYDKSKLPWK